MTIDHESPRPLDMMCTDMARHHASLRRSLPRIRESFDALPPREASPAAELMRTAFTALADMLEAHLTKEEHLLYPALSALSDAERTGRGRPVLPFATLLYPIRMMETEHLRLEDALDTLLGFAADASRGSVSPEWQRCLGELHALADELRRHDRFENEVLFPAALDLEHRLV